MKVLYGIVHRMFNRVIVWNGVLKNISNISPKLPCSSNLSYFRNIVWYCHLKKKQIEYKTNTTVFIKSYLL